VAAEDEVDQADREQGDGTHMGWSLDSATFDLEMLNKRLQISDILVSYVRDGARTLSEVQQAMMAICDGTPLREVLPGGEHVAGTGCLAGQPQLSGRPR